MDTVASLGVTWPPPLPWMLVWGLALVAVAVVVLLLVTRPPGWTLRFLLGAALVLVLLEPHRVERQARSLPNVVLVATDTSPSMSFGTRAADAAAATESLTKALQTLPDTVVRTVAVGTPAKGPASKTEIAAALRMALDGITTERLGAVILVTDGQVHDASSLGLDVSVPVHALLAGQPDEVDRILRVTKAPVYGLVGDSVALTVTVEQRGETSTVPLPLSIQADDGRAETIMVVPGLPQRLSLPLDHAGANLFTMAIPARDDEVTAANNRATVKINGVRDRLRVLLISGIPHAGERAWRNLLKADPAVDLVHFTILRSVDDLTPTPLHELALIPFPARELFEQRLQEFDLVVFDRYSQRGLLTQSHLANVASYVRSGGALLMAVGPEFAGAFSLYASPLGPVLPAVPSGGVTQALFRPSLTQDGLRHPVTRVLSQAQHDWGRWARHVDVAQPRGTILMTGDGAAPLVLVDRVEAGRVALVASDSLWLWQRGFEGGGPHGTLFRRLAHWLMDEPSLAEDRLAASVADGTLTIERFAMDSVRAPVTVSAPDGKSFVHDLEAGDEPGVWRATVPAVLPGVYAIHQERGAESPLQAAVVVGEADPHEFRHVVATGDRLADVVTQSKGATVWLARDGVPRIRQVGKQGGAAGRGWIGVRQRGAMQTESLQSAPFLPPFVAVVLVVGFAGLAWWREAWPNRARADQFV